MNVFEQLLTGEMEMSEFVYLLKNDQAVRAEINKLIPEQAKGNKEHAFWSTRLSYSSLKNFNFDLLQFLAWIARFDGSIGDNLNIFDIIQAVYLYHYPDLSCTQSYHDAFGLYLDVVKDCYDGPEVDDLVQKVIQNALAIKGKGKRIAQAKAEIQHLFHTENSKRPRWIQGAEWPMGDRSPMKYISQKRKGECVQYLFEDVDTKETRIVEQFY